MNKTKPERELEKLKKMLKANEEKMADLKIRSAQISKRAAELEKFVKAFDDLEKKYNEQFPDEETKPKRKKPASQQPKTEVQNDSQPVESMLDSEESDGSSSPDDIDVFSMFDNII